MNDIYSPFTGEHIWTDNPADWMSKAGVPAPEYDPVASSCFWRGDGWEIVSVSLMTLPVPAAVTMRQARLALLSSGLLAQVSEAIAAMPGVDGEAARIEWEYAQEVRRDSPLVAAIAMMAGLDQQQIDSLFIAAAGL